jgi:Protein of unknown function (DUF3108)
MVRCFTLLLLALPVTAAADPGPAVIDLTYAGYASGLHVVTMQSELQLTTSGYRIAMAGQTTGITGFVYHAHWQSWADGAWNGPSVNALHFDSNGVYGGDPRQVEIAFRGRQAVVQALQPPDDGEHTPVPPTLTHNVIDGLSLTALVVHQVATLGHCVGQVTTFDGRQVESLTLAGDGTEMLPATGRSNWRGPTQRCRINARVLAGFYRDENDDPLRTHTEFIWLGNVLSGVPLLPVRMTASSNHIGQVMLYLIGAKLK